MRGPAIDPTLPPESWAPARRAARALASPIQRILAIEAASGLLLMAALLLLPLLLPC